METTMDTYTFFEGVMTGLTFQAVTVLLIVIAVKWIESKNK